MRRIAVIILRNYKGNYFAHQRRAEKRLYPGLYGLGAGGSIEPDETPLDGARRELREETGIVADPQPLFDFRFSDTTTNHQIYTFLVCSSEQPQCDRREWQWAGWLSEHEIDRLLEDEKMCPDTAILYRRYRST